MGKSLHRFTVAFLTSVLMAAAWPAAGQVDPPVPGSGKAASVSSLGGPPGLSMPGASSADEFPSVIPGHLNMTHPGSPILTVTGCFVTFGTWRRT